MTNEEIKSVCVPLPDFVRQVAREAALAAAREVIVEHVRNCPVAASLQLTRAKLVGFIIGASCVGGGAGAAVVKLLTAL